MQARKMQADDLARVVSIEREANRFPWTLRNFEDCLHAGHQAWVYAVDNKLIGYAIVQAVLDEAHLLNICVAPNWQRQGYGRRILQHLIDTARTAEAALMVLEVRRSNHRAQELYLQTGFNEMSIRRGYYPAEGGREDAILMGLDLDMLSFFDVS